MESHEDATKSSQINGDSAKSTDNREKTESLGGSDTLDHVHRDASKLAGTVVHTTMALTNSMGKPDIMLPQGLSKNTSCARGTNGDSQIWRKAKKQLVSACFTSINKSIVVSLSSLKLTLDRKLAQVL